MLLRRRNQARATLPKHATPKRLEQPVLEAVPDKPIQQGPVDTLPDRCRADGSTASQEQHLGKQKREAVLVDHVLQPESPVREVKGPDILIKEILVPMDIAQWYPPATWTPNDELEFIRQKFPDVLEAVRIHHGRADGGGAGSW